MESGTGDRDTTEPGNKAVKGGRFLGKNEEAGGIGCPALSKLPEETADGYRTRLTTLRLPKHPDMVRHRPLRHSDMARSVHSAPAADEGHLQQDTGSTADSDHWETSELAPGSRCRTRREGKLFEKEPAISGEVCPLLDSLVAALSHRRVLLQRVEEESTATLESLSKSSSPETSALLAQGESWFLGAERARSVASKCVSPSLTPPEHHVVTTFEALEELARESAAATHEIYKEEE